MQQTGIMIGDLFQAINQKEGYQEERFIIRDVLFGEGRLLKLCFLV